LAATDEVVARRICEILRDVVVVTERELKVRLEREYFPWVVGRVLGLLLREGKVVKRGYPGRRRLGRGAPQFFYMLAGTAYSAVMKLIQKKREVTAYLNAQLTAESVAGFHAENLFEQGFEDAGFVIAGRDVSEYKGRRVRAVEGKEPANVDFVVERNGIAYGVDVKNWLYYEVETRDVVKKKVAIALELGTVPWVVARYIDKETIYLEVYKKGGLVYPYVRLLLPSALDSLASEAQSLLGYPVMAVDVLPDFMVRWVSKLHDDYVSRRRS